MRRRPEFWRRPRPDGTLGKVYWTNLGGQRVSTKCPTLEAARRWKDARELERADPRRAAAEAATLEDAVRDLYAELRRRGRSAGTLERAKQKLSHFPRLWGTTCKMSEIDARKVASYIDARLADSLEATGFKTPQRITVRDELAFLRQLLKLARRHGIFAAHVDDVMPMNFETGHKPRKDFVVEADMPKLLEHVTPEHAAHLCFFFTTAGRLADSYRARREDFDTVKWRATVRGSKTDGSFRTIPVPDFVRLYVERMLRDAIGDDVLFVDWPNLDRDLKAACGRAGIPKVSSNGLRRTFGKWLRLHGYSLSTISKLFGHTTEKLARDVYADVEGDDLAAMVDLESGKRRAKISTREDEIL